MVITEETRRQHFNGTRLIRMEQMRRAAASLNAELGSSSGTWTAIEHDLFLEGLERFPSGPWKLVAQHVGTRTPRQVMTHAQKYRYRLQRLALREQSSAPPPTHVVPLAMSVADNTNTSETAHAMAEDQTSTLCMVVSQMLATLFPNAAEAGETRIAPNNEDHSNPQLVPQPTTDLGGTAMENSGALSTDPSLPDIDSFMTPLGMEMLDDETLMEDEELVQFILEYCG